jgi:hypothetical protein
MLNQSCPVNGLFFDDGPKKETVIMEDFYEVSNATKEDASNNEMYYRESMVSVLVRR